jgi:hypothetical protein
MPGFADALKTFAARITENFATNVAAQPEDQLKAPVQDLLRIAGTLFGIVVVPRTEAQVADLQGRPDIGVAVDGLLCGFIELKAPGLGADPERLRGEQNKRQWDKFKSLPNLIYTDGNAWVLYRVGERAAAPIRFAGDVTENGAKAIDDGIAERLQALLRSFLFWEPIVPHNPRELAAYLAPLARLIRTEVHEAASRKGSAIAVVAAQWRDRLFPHADDQQFADAYAQTLTYALLLARLSGARDLTPDRAADVLDSGNGLLAETLRVLGHRSALHEIALAVSGRYSAR